MKELLAIKEARKAIQFKWDLEFSESSWIWINQPRVKNMRLQYIGVSPTKMSFNRYDQNKNGFDTVEIEGDFSTLVEELEEFRPKFEIEGFVDGESENARGVN